MSRKMVIFDIDGTLVTEQKIIPFSAKEAIRALKRNGIAVAIATARPPFLFKEICSELDIHSFVAFNGQYVVSEGEVIYENPIAAEEVVRLHEASSVNKYPMIFMDNQEMRATVAGHPHVEAGLSKLHFAYPEVDCGFHEDKPIYQALLFCEKDKEHSISCKEGKSRFIRWHEYSLDVLPGGGSKAIGIEKLLDASGISRSHTYAFGDGPNDVEMIEEAGIGVAMGNAVPEIRKAADYITDDVDRDGVYKGLKYLELI